MFSLAEYVDLPLVWAAIIGLAIFMYVFLDGFDLGVGILFPFAPTDECKSRMMNSIAPFWDGNETWLVLGGGGLFMVFPLAYSLILPAMYFPFLFMMVALIFRGIAFEFRFKAGNKSRKYWDASFHFGSLIASFSQGLILGGFIQGIHVEGRSYVGGAFDWLTAFSIVIGIAVVFGYALLGATWVILKAEGVTQTWAKKCALYSIIHVLFFITIIAIWLPFIRAELIDKWLLWPHMLLLILIPGFIILISFIMVKSILKGHESLPFLMSVILFSICYIGVAVLIFPYIVPYEITIREAAATPETQSLALVAVAILLPVILSYTAYSYYVFKGKTDHQPLY